MDVKGRVRRLERRLGRDRDRPPRVVLARVIPDGPDAGRYRVDLSGQEEVLTKEELDARLQDEDTEVILIVTRVRRALDSSGGGV